MATVNFVRGNTDYINSVSISNGQMLFDTTKKTLYVDDNGIRKNFGTGDAQNISFENTVSNPKKRVTSTNVNGAINELATKCLNSTDVVNNLSNTSGNMPLSAYQGYLLNENSKPKLIYQDTTNGNSTLNIFLMHDMAHIYFYGYTYENFKNSFKTTLTNLNIKPKCRVSFPITLTLDGKGYASFVHAGYGSDGSYDWHCKYYDGSLNNSKGSPQDPSTKALIYGCLCMPIEYISGTVYTPLLG